MKLNKIWIFQSKEELNENQKNIIQNKISEFLNSWNSHGFKLKPSYEIILNKFLIIKNDENNHEASGCSIDSLIDIIKKIDAELNLELLNRMLVSYIKNNIIKTISFSNLKEKIKNKEILETDYIYNLSVSNQEEFNNEFCVTLNKSWAKIYLD